MGTQLKNYDSVLVPWALTLQGLSYIWGETDCGTLVRRGLILISDKDPFLNIPYWNTEQKARQIWHDLGGVDKGFIDLGARLVHTNYVQTGDVGLLTIAGEETSFLVIANRYLFSTKNGIKFRKIINWDKFNVRFYRFV